MAKVKKRYRCNVCDASWPQWSGQCGECGSWNTLQAVEPAQATSTGASVVRLSQVAEQRGAKTVRHSTGISELDRVLGGGLVAGSVTLIGGDPGIGKSTLLLQAMARLSQSLPVLYASGEESIEQITISASRLQLQHSALQLLAETAIETIITHVQQEGAQVLVIDSIQTMYSHNIQAMPGAITQLRETTASIVRFAKQSGTAVLIVGHVTKEGALAGPRVLEHMVDTVLYFEGDPGSRYRMLRTCKNRFGALNELGVFAMDERGLHEVRNPSAIFLSHHPEPVAGSVITVTRHGNRPLLVETQALVDRTQANGVRRVALGLDSNRLNMLLAVLNRNAGIALYDYDVFFNVVGGVRINETASDLPMLLAAVSSLRDRPVSNSLICFGEVGLAGEIRPVPDGEERLRAAAKQGFTAA